MANQVILLDSSVLIDYFRKKNKERTAFIRLVQAHSGIAISVVTRYEILLGSTIEQTTFWNQVFDSFKTFPLSVAEIDMAVGLQRSLKKKNQQIDLPDLLIAATAIVQETPLATLNKRHFSRIEDLVLAELI